MMRAPLFYLLFFVSSLLHAQPGGGGGLFIDHLCTPDGKDIGWDKLNVHAFVLKDSSKFATIIHETYFDHLHLQTANDTVLSGKYFVPDSAFIYPGGIDLPPEFHFYQANINMKLKYQRLVITYKSDVDLDSMMIVDFIGVWMENGMGMSETLDTLLLKPGYSRYIHEGNGLSRQWTMEYEPKIDRFRQETEIPPAFYLRRGEHDLALGDLSNAYTDVTRALSGKGLSVSEKAEAYITLTKIQLLKYDSTHDAKDINQAVYYATQTINLLRPFENGRLFEWNYESRIEVYTKGHLYENALRDHDTLVLISENKIARNEDRALFKINYMHDYDGAITDLNKALDTVSFAYSCFTINCVTNYGRTYFIRGLAEYRKGEIRTASKTWLKAMEFRYGMEPTFEPTLQHFDTIISKHPKIPELYLARVIAANYFARYPNPGKDSILNSALSDLTKAEQLGIKDYRINLYRAVILSALHRYEEALAESDLAIKKSGKNPECYSIRYAVRNGLGQTKWGDENDPDWVYFQMYSKTWVYQK